MAHYEVIVGNVGKIYDGDSAEDALDDFYDCVKASKNWIGAVAGEAVTMMQDGRRIHEHKAIRFEVGDRVSWNAPPTTPGHERQVESPSSHGSITMMIDKSQARVLLDSGVEAAVLVRDLQRLKKFRIVIEETHSQSRAKVFEGVACGDAIHAANSDTPWQEDNGWKERGAVKSKREIRECLAIEE